jgi:hypothetical protein
MVAIAKHKGVVKGRKMRVDTTVVETKIHYPTDSSLLGDVLGGLVYRTPDEVRRGRIATVNDISDATGCRAHQKAMIDVVEMPDHRGRGTSHTVCRSSRTKRKRLPVAATSFSRTFHEPPRASGVPRGRTIFWLRVACYRINSIGRAARAKGKVNGGDRS